MPSTIAPANSFRVLTLRRGLVGSEGAAAADSAPASASVAVVGAGEVSSVGAADSVSASVAVVVAGEVSSDGAVASVSVGGSGMSCSDALADSVGGSVSPITFSTFSTFSAMGQPAVLGGHQIREITVRKRLRAVDGDLVERVALGVHADEAVEVVGVLLPRGGTRLAGNAEGRPAASVELEALHPVVRVTARVELEQLDRDVRAHRRVLVRTLRAALEAQLAQRGLHVGRAAVLLDHVALALLVAVRVALHRTRAVRRREQEVAQVPGVDAILHRADHGGLGARRR